MTGEDAMKSVKEGVSVVSEIIKAAGDNPQVKEAASNLGKTAVTLTKTINNVLVPLAAINFAFDKARVYFSGKFQEDIAEKTATIPAEHVVEPKASIAGPMLQGLAFTHEEPDLKEMYLNLLATSMDGRIASVAHPAFVEIIKQLDSVDAKLINNILKATIPIPIVQLLRSYENNGGYIVLQDHLLNLKESNGEAAARSGLAAVVDNWIRLGLVAVDYDRHLTDRTQYEWAEQRPEFLHFNAQPQTGSKVEVKRGILECTALGKRFASAVGL